MGWVCKYCSTNNENGDSRCIVCDKRKSTDAVCTLTVNRVRKLNLMGDIVIPSEFNVIGKDAFLNRMDVTTVTLHAGVRKIMENAFSGCKNLQKVASDTELEYIGRKAFYNCEKLSSSNRPMAKRVSDDAFEVDTVSAATASTHSYPSHTSQTKDTSASHSNLSTGAKVFTWLILASIILSLLLPVIAMITSYAIPWKWFVGIGGGFLLLFIVYAVSVRLEDSFEPCSVATVLFWLVSIINVILLYVIKSNYEVISALFNLFFAVGIGTATSAAFSNRKPVCAAFAMLVLATNIYMFFVSMKII